MKVRDDASEKGVTEIATDRPPMHACTRTWGKAGEWLARIFDEAYIHVRLYTGEQILSSE